MRIETNRLRLESVTRAAAPRLWSAIEISLPDLSPWMAWTESATLRSTEEWAADAERRAAESGDRVFVVSAGDEVVGVVGVERVDHLNRRAAVGYWTRADRAGRGFATEAGAAAVEHAFTKIGIHRLVLLAGVENHASNRVARKLGFRFEGVARDGARGAFDFYDCNVYGLLEHDPRP